MADNKPPKGLDEFLAEDNVQQEPTIADKAINYAKNAKDAFIDQVLNTPRRQKEALDLAASTALKSNPTPEEREARETVYDMTTGSAMSTIGGKPYKGSHTSPSPGQGAPLHNMTKFFPNDIYSKDAARIYGHGADKAQDLQSIKIIQKVKENPDAEVTVYRAVPKGVKEINPGDWVSINKDYAKSHGDALFDGNYTLLEKKVPAKELFTSDSIHEQGWHPVNKPKLDMSQEARMNRAKELGFNPKKSKSGKLSYAEGGEVMEAQPQDTQSDDLLDNVMPNEPIDPTAPINQQNVQNEPQGLDEFLASDPEYHAFRTSNDPNLQSTPEPEGLNSWLAPELEQAKYSTPSQQLKAGLEGAAQGIAGPLAPLAQTKLGISTPEDILAREKYNPLTHAGSEVAGLVGSAMTGLGLGAGLEKLGTAVAARTLPTVGKIGSSVVRGAAENAIFQLSDEASKYVLNDPNSVDQAVMDVGLAAILGGGAMGAMSGVGSLWDAAAATKTADMLKLLTKKLGGTEVPLKEGAHDLIAKTGIELEPTLKGVLSSDPQAQELFNTLRQSDTTASGKEVQQSYNDFIKKSGDIMVEATGKNPEEAIHMPEVSKYEHGKNIGDTLASEYHEQLSPIAQKFEEYKDRFGTLELPKEVKSPTGQVLEHSAMQTASDKISQLAIEQGWAASPSSDIMKEVNRVIKELPLQQNIRDLGNYITQVGNNTADFTNGPLRRAGGLIKNILKDIESDVIESELKKDVVKTAINEHQILAPIEEFRLARAAYRNQSELKDALNDRLHVKGANTSNFTKGLKEMAQTDGESVLRRLSGINDADLLNFLNKHYPKTASELRQYHIDNLVKTAVDKAAPDHTINNAVLLRNIEKLSPELKGFLFTPESLDKIRAIGTLTDEFNKLPYNYSNTARTLDKLMGGIPSTATGLISAIVSHSPVIGALTAGLTKALSKDIPDAVKLAMLKFLGSAQPVDATAFKATSELIHHSVEGERLLNKSVQNLFKQKEGEIIPLRLVPTEKQNIKLDKQVEKLFENQTFTNLGEKVAYYMPDHGTALTRSISGIMSYVNSQKPRSLKQTPLDQDLPLNPLQIAKYNRVLTIANQPLVVLDRIKSGAITTDEIKALKAMYPNIYSRISSKIEQEAINALAKGIDIPYNTKLGMSLFMQRPMDSTMLPTSIIAAQIANKIAPEGAISNENQQPKGRPSSPALNHSPDAYKTNLQQMEMRSQRRK